MPSTFSTNLVHIVGTQDPDILVLRSYVEVLGRRYRFFFIDETSMGDFYQRACGLTLHPFLKKRFLKYAVLDQKIMAQRLGPTGTRTLYVLMGAAISSENSSLKESEFLKLLGLPDISASIALIRLELEELNDRMTQMLRDQLKAAETNAQVNSTAVELEKELRKKKKGKPGGHIILNGGGGKFRL